MQQTARRISEEVASSKKKINIVISLEGSEEPMTVISAKTSVAGKHGTAKTVMRLKHYFTHKVVDTILSSAERVSMMKDHPNYNIKKGILLNYDGNKKIAEVIDHDQVLLQLACELKPTTTEIEYESWADRYYRLKV